MNEVIEEKIKPVFAKVRNFLHENFLQHLLVQKFEIVVVNRYSRGLETCPQANLAKSGRKYFLLFSDASERRVSVIYCMTQRRVEKTRVHFWTFSPISVNEYFNLLQNRTLF